MFLYMLLQVVSHYMIFLSMSVMGFQKNLEEWVSGWGELYPFFVEFIQLCKDPYQTQLAKSVLFSQPRRVAATTVAERVSMETGTELGELVRRRILCCFEAKIKAISSDTHQ